ADPAPARRAPARGGARGVREGGRHPRRDPAAGERGPRVPRRARARSPAGAAGSQDSAESQVGGPAMSAPGNFAQLFASSASWLRGEGPHADMVLSTRIRLARNLSDVPFTHRARDEQLHGVLAAVSAAAQPSKLLAGGLLLKMQDCSPIERQV